MSAPESAVHEAAIAGDPAKPQSAEEAIEELKEKGVQIHSAEEALKQPLAEKLLERMTTLETRISEFMTEMLQFLDQMKSEQDNHAKDVGKVIRALNDVVTDFKKAVTTMNSNLAKMQKLPAGAGTQQAPPPPPKTNWRPSRWNDYEQIAFFDELSEEELKWVSNRETHDGWEYYLTGNGRKYPTRRRTRR